MGVFLCYRCLMWYGGSATRSTPTSPAAGTDAVDRTVMGGRCSGTNKKKNSNGTNFNGIVIWNDWWAIKYVSFQNKVLSHVVVVLMFSYQRSRKASVRLHALSFYLQEKKVKTRQPSERQRLFAVSNWSAVCQCFPEKADVNAALDLMLQVQPLHFPFKSQQTLQVLV